MAASELVYGEHTARLSVTAPTLAGPASTGFSGGTLSVDPTCPTTLVEIVLDSTEIDDLAGIVRVLAETPVQLGRSGEPIPIVGLEPQDRLPLLQRLAFATWFAAYNPLPIEQALVQLDVAAAAWGAGQLVLGHDLFERHAQFLLTLLVRRVPNQSERNNYKPCVSEAEASALRRTAGLCAEALGDEHPASAKLIEAAIKLETQRHDVRDRPMIPVRDLADLLPPAPVDWEMVPPRTVSTDEGGILWERTGAVITVTVAAHPKLGAQSPATDRLIVRLIGKDTGEALIAAKLELVELAGGNCFRAEIDAAEIDVDAVFPDIVDVRKIQPARVGNEAATARIRRSAIRALTSTRISWITRDCGYDDVGLRLTPDRSIRTLASELARYEPRSEPEREGVNRTQAWIEEVRANPAEALGLTSAVGAPLLSELLLVSAAVRESQSNGAPR